MKSSKVRLTITLPEDLLQSVDGLVDRHTIRNRSHAVEYLIRKTLSPRVRTAVLLAGAKQAGVPSPALTKIHTHPLILLTVEHLRQYGIQRLIVCAGPYTQEVQHVLGNGEAVGLEVLYVEEPQPLGTAGALKLVQKHLDNEPFLVVHGDVLTTLNLSEFIEFHMEQGTLATMAVKPRQSQKKFGQVFLQGNKIIRFLGSGQSEGISIVNTGLYVLQPEVLERIPGKQQSALESDIFPKLAEERELSAFIFQGIWHDISTRETLEEARQQWLLDGEMKQPI